MFPVLLIWFNALCQVSCQRLCRRHILLLLWNDFRRRWHPGPFQQNAHVIFCPANFQFRFLLAAAVPFDPLSAAQTAQVRFSTAPPVILAARHVQVEQGNRSSGNEHLPSQNLRPEMAGETVPQVVSTSWACSCGPNDGWWRAVLGDEQLYSDKLGFEDLRADARGSTHCSFALHPGQPTWSWTWFCSSKRFSLGFVQFVRVRRSLRSGGFDLRVSSLIGDVGIVSLFVPLMLFQCMQLINQVMHFAYRNVYNHHIKLLICL